MLPNFRSQAGIGKGGVVLRGHVPPEYPEQLSRPLLGIVGKR